VQDCCVPDGTIEGQVLRWDNTLMEWVATDILILEQTNSSLVTNNSIAFQVNNGGSNNVSMQLLESDPSMLLSITDGSDSATLKVGTITGGFGVEVTTSDYVSFSANEGIKIVSFVSAPGAPTDKLYNIGGDLYWNGSQVCLAPCGGGAGEPIPAGTVNYSTLRWDTLGSVWLENVFTRMNDGTWSTIMYGDAIVSPSVGNAQIIYASIFKGTAPANVNSNASFILASGTDDITPIFVTHTAPSLSNPFSGYNGMIGTYRCNILLDSQIGGCLVLGSNQGVINKSTSDLGEGFSVVLASNNSSISQSIDYNALIGVQQCQVTYGSRCVITASTSSIFTSSATNVSINCEITSSLSSEIRTYSSGVAVKQSERAFLSSSQNSVMRGVTSSGMMATQSCTIKSHGASTTTYSQLLNLTTMVSCFNCTIQQSSTLHFSSMYAVNMLACDSCTVDTQDSNLDATAFVGCKTVSLTQSGSSAGLDGSAFVGCSNLTITLTNAQSNVVLLGLNAGHGVTDLRSNTVYAPTVEVKETIIYTGENIVSASGPIPNLVHRIIADTAGTTQTLSAVPFDGETHVIVSDFPSALSFTTVDGNGKTIQGASTINVPGDENAVTIEYSLARDKWYITGKSY
jgi:hypothetical protein